ncbi:hypothetical protein C7S16_6604 [Burkholderia thailandensis]|uniref:Bacteriophage protein n=1 Tax=Burkholderia thailandensis TaxID=57975 RepID=A0AAW9CQH1_BURTH|nr:hypothetical protein [Burkholderia thailandensis]
MAIPQSVINALRFYANGHHFNIDEDHQQFDTVSGEPQNWLCSERDDDCTMIEDGSIAKAALCGGVLGFEESEKPIEGEVFTAAQQPAQADARVGLTDEQIMNIADSYSFKWDEGIIAFARALLATPQPEPRAEVTDTQRLDWLRDECCDLRSVSVPTGGDDYEVNWIVIQHHMIAPHEREIGRGFSDDPRDAIDAARTGASS